MLPYDTQFSYFLAQLIEYYRSEAVFLSVCQPGWPKIITDTLKTCNPAWGSLHAPRTSLSGYPPCKINPRKKFPQKTRTFTKTFPGHSRWKINRV